ncbi:MAG TPA: hypothetical protein VHD56_07785 [Tepidisphaeraceae bacterium]|nr:hypothetical protein [Tepidisphaeraceae bacterium]
MTDALPQSPAQHKHTATIIAIGACVLLLLCFAGLSCSASRTKSATYDEPLHLVSGIARRTTGSFVMDAEDPSFFGYWASLPFGHDSVKLRFNLKIGDELVHEDHHAYQWAICMVTLFDTPENNADEIVQKSRMMFLFVAILLGGLIAWWSWRLAGPAAAVIATALFAFDPGFLGHASIVKNDVMFSFAFVAMAMAMWQFGRRGTGLSLAAMAMACGLSLNIKFSGTLCGLILFVGLLIRALLPQPWTVLGRNLVTRAQRTVAAVLACVAVALISMVMIWSCYDFRFSSASGGLPPLDMSNVIERLKHDRIAARMGGNGDLVTAEMVRTEPQGGVASAVMFADSIHLLPQAWLWGFLYTYTTTILRNSYLLGEIGTQGWWFYFPCVILFKTPVATLLAMLAGSVGITIALTKLFSSESRASINWWPTIGAALPGAIYFFSALNSTMNIGIRHILPVYPFIFMAVGVGLAGLVRSLRHVGVSIVSVLLFGLLVETLTAYPNYIAFFNFPSGGINNGIRLLGDSNLDWGQDLKLLAQWQKAASPKKMYLCYFGTADPAYYGIKATHMPGGWMFANERVLPSESESCYVAISATHLQGIFYDEHSREIYRGLLQFNPIAILGGSIYIYEFPMQPQMRKTSG